MHRPSIGALVRSSRVAIEVELWRRPPSRLRALLSDYGESIALRHVDGLITVSDRVDVLDALTRAAGQVGLPERCFGTRRLADVQAAARLLTQHVAPGHSDSRDSDGSRREE